MKQSSMDQLFLDPSIDTLSNGLIESIDTNNNTMFVTISYADCINCRRRNQTIRLVISNRTLILNESGNRIPASQLTKGMVVNASFSSAMTRSIPPQTNAYLIQVVRRPAAENITIGRIINIDRTNRNFTTIRDGDPSSVIRFNVPMDARIFDILGRPMNFSNLTPGLRVRVNHASFMTARIPPQTTAFEIRVIR